MENSVFGHMKHVAEWYVFLRKRTVRPGVPALLRGTMRFHDAFRARGFVMHLDNKLRQRLRAALTNLGPSNPKTWDWSFYRVAQTLGASHFIEPFYPRPTVLHV